MNVARGVTASVLASFLLAIGLTLIVPTPSAFATEQPAIEIGPNERVSIDYPQIVGNNAANQAIDPETCRQPITTYCYAIHLHLKRPADLNPDDEFTIRFKLSWEVLVEDIDVPTQGEMTSNDMDFFIWDYPYTTKRADGTDTEDVGSAATGAQPEQTSFNTPKADDFWLVIVNFVGVNQGSNLSISWDPEVFPSPYEDLGDTLRPHDASADTASVTPSFITPSAAPPASPAEILTGGFEAAAASLPGLPSLTTVDVDESAFIDDVDANLDNELLTEAKRLTARPATTIRAAKPVAAVVVGFWLVAVPLVLLVFAAAWLIRRRPAALSL